MMASRVFQSTSRVLARRAPLSLRRYSAAAEAVTEDYVTPVPGPSKSESVSPVVASLVEAIAGLSLAQVCELNEALRLKLGLPDISAMPMGVAAAAPAAAALPAEAEVVEKKTSFKVVLKKFDDTKKIALIKEIKSTVPGINLVQAKKFVESVPKPVVEDVGKDEADKIKAALEAVGGVCDVE